MIQQTAPMTLLELVDRIKEKSNDTLLSTISANGGKAEIKSIAPLETAGHGDVAFLANSRYRDAAAACKATALVLTEEDKQAIWGEKEPDRIVVITRNPYAWFAYALQIIFPQEQPEPGVDTRAVVEDGAVIDSTATVEAGAVIRKGAQVGPYCFVGANSVIGEGVVLGEHTRIYPNVTIYYGCRIGRRNIIHSGAVIGADGFGFAPLDRQYVKIPQIGAVETGDDVEIGANTCIDRGALQNTTIGQGTKIDDLVMILSLIHMWFFPEELVWPEARLSATTFRPAADPVLQDTSRWPQVRSSAEAPVFRARSISLITMPATCLPCLTESSITFCP